MTDIELFNFQNNNVTVFIDESGCYWFKGIDVLKTLGNSDNAARTIKQIVFPEYYDTIDTGIGGKPTIYLLEPGVYQIALHPKFKSKMARMFQKWVFEKVLPRLREKGLATSPIKNETESQYKERDSKLLELNSKLLAENKLLKIERDAAVEDCHQMAFESFAHICYDCFGITIDEYKHFLKFGYGFKYKKFPTISYEKLLTKIHKYFNRLVLMEHKPDFRTPAKQAEIIAKWNEKRPNKPKNAREIKVTSLFQQKHDFLGFVIFLVDFEKNKLVKEGLVNWTETVNLS